MKGIIMAVMLATHSPAVEPKELLPCWIIKPYVLIYGEEFVIRWARSHGYKEISWKFRNDARSKMH